jgi:hypothetical protein
MKHLLATLAAACAFAVPAEANLVGSLGNNPTSATGHFSNSVFGTTFSDDWTFNLVGFPQFVAFASATNDFASPTDFITGFAGQLWSFGPNGVYNNGLVDDLAVNPVALSHACTDNPATCQELSGNAILNSGGYFLRLTGTGGGTAGYGGDLTTAAVPGPMLGAGLPGLLAACLGMVGLNWRRRRQRRLAHG